MISHIFLLTVSAPVNGHRTVVINDMIHDHEEVWTTSETDLREWARFMFVSMKYTVKEVSEIGFVPSPHFYVITDKPEVSLKEATEKLEFD
jgi:hypothetical protein